MSYEQISIKLDFTLIYTFYFVIDFSFYVDNKDIIYQKEKKNELETI